MQVDTWERGFFLQLRRAAGHADGPAQKLDAREVVNAWPERRLAQILREYGDERYAPQIARAIVRVRERAPIETTSNGSSTHRRRRARPCPLRPGGHPAKRSFQAIRIAVNDELGAARCRAAARLAPAARRRALWQASRFTAAKTAA